MPATDSVSSAVTDKEPLLYKTEVDVDSIPFLLLEMNSKTCRVEMADSVIPNINDSSVALCVEAAFTGKLLHEFKSENVSGDYIVGGKLKKDTKPVAIPASSLLRMVYRLSHLPANSGNGSKETMPMIAACFSRCSSFRMAKCLRWQTNQDYFQKHL